MYRRKYPKTNLRNPKNINPNPIDSDQRERKTQATMTQACEPQAWVARGLGLLGSHTVV